MAPDDPTSGCSCPRMSPSPWVLLTGLLIHFWWRDKLETTGNNGISPWHLESKKSVAAIWVLAHSVTCFKKSQLPGSELTYAEAQVALNWGRTPANNQWGTEVLSPTTHEELSPATHHTTTPRSRLFSFEPSDDSSAPAHRLTEVSWRLGARQGHYCD